MNGRGKPETLLPILFEETDRYLPKKRKTLKPVHLCALRDPTDWKLPPVAVKLLFAYSMITLAALFEYGQFCTVA